MSTAAAERVKEITANKFISTFLIVRKVAKEARTLKIIARISFHYAKANELARKAGLKQHSPFYATLQEIL